MSNEIHYLVFLDDWETYSSLDGCVIVGIQSANHEANDAIDSEDFEAVMDLADVVLPILHRRQSGFAVVASRSQTVPPVSAARVSHLLTGVRAREVASLPTKEVVVRLARPRDRRGGPGSATGARFIRGARSTMSSRSVRGG